MIVLVLLKDQIGTAATDNAEEGRIFHGVFAIYRLTDTCYLTFAIQRCCKRTAFNYMSSATYENQQEAERDT